MRVVVTGAGGMLGTEVVRRFRENAREIVALDRSATEGVLEADVTDRAALDRAFRSAEVVVHLAAVKRPGIVPDDELFHTNVMGTYEVVEACVRAAVGRLVFASSTAVLGTDWGRRERIPRYLPFDEHHPLEPEDVYGLSKVVGEAIARAAHLRTGLEVAVLRPAWIVTDLEFEELRLSGGAAPRGIHHHAYVHVRDAADAFVRAAEAELAYEVMYLAADDSTLQESLAAVLPREVPAIGDLAASLSGTRPGLSNARARAVLGWRPVRSWRGRT